MKALSIHQPWAWAIMHAGKTIENRTWRTSHRGPLLIHASKSRASYNRWAADWSTVFDCHLPPWSSLPAGAIVGTVDVVDCVRFTSGLGLWGEGPWCWVLEGPQVFEVPVAYRGGQMLFEVPDGVLPVK